MKKSIIYFILLFTIRVGQELNIPDDNFKAALIEHPELDTNEDGLIQVSETESYIGNIYVSNKEIKK